MKPSQEESLFKQKQKLSDRPIFVNPLKFVEQKQQQKVVTKINYSSSNLLVDLSEEKSNHKGKIITKPSKIKHYKTRMCPDGRECRRQFVCHFAHNQHQLRKPFIKRTEPCVRYQKGLCNLGSVCRLYHGNIQLKKKYEYKGSPCVQFTEKGYCGKGKLCIYVHPQKQSENIQEVRIRQNQQMNSQLQNISEKEVKQVQKYTKQIQIEAAKPQQKKNAKQIVQVIQQKIGDGDIIQQDFGFNINFTF